MIMNINRHTYEEFFLLYVDNELNEGEKKVVEEFVRDNPDLEPELLLLKDSVFTPDETVCFEDKDSLYRHERRAVAITWYRIAAAAILLIAFMLTGWLYLGSEHQLRRPEPLAAKELLKDVDDDKLEKSDPAVSASTERYESPSEIIRTGPLQPPASSTLAINVSREAIKIQQPREAREKPVIEELARDTDHPDPIKFNTDFEEEETPKQIIDVAVEPRGIQDEYVIGASLQEPLIRYAETEENDMIYFANTALPKKTKLRGIFRKATRILDKVTSLQ